jgi:alpha-glucosidase
VQTAFGLGASTLKAAALYPLRKVLAEIRWSPDGRRYRGLAMCRAIFRTLAPRQPIWNASGPVHRVVIQPRGATLPIDGGEIEIRFLAADFVEVQYRYGAIVRDEPVASYAVARPISDWPAVTFAPLEDGRALWLQTGQMVIGVDLETGRVCVATQEGALLRADVDVATTTDGQARHRVALAPGERIFGLGERATPWNRRGRIHRLWNRDPVGYRPGDDPLYLNVPAYLGVVSRTDGTADTYFVFYDNPGDATFDLGASIPTIADHRFSDGPVRYYIAIGPVHRCLALYTELTGRHTLQPLWMLGYQQSRWSYDSEARVRKLAADFVAHAVPCDAFHLDIDVMDGYRCFTWDRARFPDLEGLSEDLSREGRKLVSIVDPGIRKDPDYVVYRNGLEGDHFCRLPDDQVLHAPAWPGECGFPDFTNPSTRLWWGDQYSPLIDAGVAGFWNDMNEPAAFAAFGDPTLPSTVRHRGDGLGSDHRMMHNVYGMQMVRATHEGLLRLRPDSRPVVISRAGWAGVQRYATSWTGDNESTWESLALTIPMVLSLGVSGVGFTGSDIGGFVGTPDGELFTRWIQMAAFMPFFRAHTVKGSPDQEPWSFGEPYLSIVRRFVELRYELLPYLYTALWQMCARGWPMVRPLAWAEPLNASLWDVDDAFLCGDALLVAPILEPGKSSRTAPLPRGDWYEFWTNQRFPGEQDVALFSQLETTPLLVRAGAVLTMGEVGPSTGQRSEKFLRLSVYAPSSSEEFVSELYEDAGEGVAYQHGVCRFSRFLVHQDTQHLTIVWTREGDYTPPYEHVELTINGLHRAPRAVYADGDSYAVARVDPVQRRVVLGVPIFSDVSVEL